MTINSPPTEAASSLSRPNNAPKPSFSPCMPSSKPPAAIPVSAHQWNTQNLPWRIMSDVAAAACASGLVAPLITIIDRSIIENASARAPLLTSILTSLKSLLLTPHIFLTSRPTRLISTVYFGTYLTANTTDTVHGTLSAAPAATTTAGPAKFFATSTVNMSLSLYKDSQFARMFGPLPSATSPASALVARTIPSASYALFALRDSFTIFASFNLPPRLAPLIPLSHEWEALVSRQSVAQILAPAGIQLLSTPLHLWGLDLYNRPHGRGRIRQVAKNWLGSSLARMGRIVPAFGVGGVVNSRVRRGLMGRLGEGV